MAQMTECERQGARITELFGQACRFLQRPCRSEDKRSMEVGKGGEQATIQKTDIHESDGFLTRRRQGIDLLKLDYARSELENTFIRLVGGADATN